ncbi:uncharacterized protein LOC124887740 [Capsicum annuum]|uniref:uncharacterized protein LOC124887740 n=1 Tax=Capsicum annuum TaxID=4072 RepID=UPI001FB073E1|nr:uncharacterized protein LOC124887740 [Capsicum annuum]
MAKLSNLLINILLLEAIQEIPGYVKLMKKLMSKKKLVEADTVEFTHGCSDVMDSKVAGNKNDPGAFTIPCTIRILEFAKALCNLGAIIKLMPFVICKKFGLDAPTPTFMRLLMVDRSIKRLVGILFDVIVKVDMFILLADFVVLGCEMDQEVPIILVHPFLATGRVIIDLEMREMKFRVQEDEVSFKICKTKKQTAELQVIFVVDMEKHASGLKGWEKVEHEELATNQLQVLRPRSQSAVAAMQTRSWLMITEGFPLSVPGIPPAASVIPPFVKEFGYVPEYDIPSLRVQSLSSFPLLVGLLLARVFVPLITLDPIMSSEGKKRCKRCSQRLVEVIFSCRRFGLPEMTWDQFDEAFLDWFGPYSLRNQIIDEFDHLE